MRRIIALTLFSLVFAAEGFANTAANRYETFRAAAERHKQKAKEEGLAYMVGGGTGLALSVGLGIHSKDAFPKVGYSLIQVLSAASVAHGAVLYYQGDGFVTEAERLRLMEAQLAGQKNISAEERKEIMNQLVAQTIRAEVQRYKQARRIRGYLELTTTVSSGLTLALSKTRSSATSTALGFIALISLVGAYNDLLGSGNPESIEELYAFDVLPRERGGEVAWTMRW